MADAFPIQHTNTLSSGERRNIIVILQVIQYIFIKAKEIYSNYVLLLPFSFLQNRLSFSGQPVLNLKVPIAFGQMYY